MTILEEFLQVLNIEITQFNEELIKQTFNLTAQLVSAFENRTVLERVAYMYAMINLSDSLMRTSIPALLIDLKAQKEKEKLPCIN